MSDNDTKHTILQILPNNGWRLAEVDESNEADPLLLTDFPAWALVEESWTGHDGTRQTRRFVAALVLGERPSELDYRPEDQADVLGRVAPNASPEQLEYWRKEAKDTAEHRRLSEEHDAQLVAEKKRSTSH